MKIKYAIFIALLFLGCSQLNQQQRGMDEKVVKEKEEKLFDATIRVLEASSDDPVAYRSARRAFEIALDRYIQATGWQSGKILHLEKKGMTLLLPVQIIQSENFSTQALPMLRDSLKILWMPVGPMFRGEIVDLQWLPFIGGYAGAESESPADNKQQPLIIALFPDSLKYLSREGNILSPNVTAVFDSAMRRDVRSSFPAGLFFPSTLTEEGLPGIPFITTHLNDIHMLVFPRDIQHGWSANPEILSDTDLDLKWRYKQGQDVLQNTGNEAEEIRSVRQLPGTNMQVLLDQKGFLILTPDTAQNPVWISDQAWGNRIFLLDSTIFAVCDSRRSTFTVFKYSGGNELHLLGRSPPFDGNVTAMTAAGDGILVNTLTCDKANHPWSQLQLMPIRSLVDGKDQLWSLAAKSNAPQYPDYNTKLIFLPEETQHLANADWVEFVPQIVWMNVYETLFCNAEDNALLPNLVSGMEYDSSRTRWRFHLKPEIRFADGALLTADDVITSWQKNIKAYAEANSNMNWYWKDIMGADDFARGSRESMEGFRVINKSTLEVILAKPIPEFPNHLSSPCFGIKKAGKRWSVGTGPFKISEIHKERSLFSIICERNPYYHRGMPPLGAIIFAFEVESPTDFLTDNRNAATTIRRVKDIEYFRAIQTFRVVPAPDEVIYLLAINPLSGSLSDLEFRRKIVSALSRETTAKMITEAESYPVDRLVSGKSTENFRVNISATGYSRASHPLTIAYCEEDPVSRRIAERLVTRLSEMEIPFRTPVEFSAKYFNQSRQKGNYDILVDTYIPSYKTDAYNLLQICNRGYVLEKEIMDQLNYLISYPDKAPAMGIEKKLIERAILYPLLMTQSYAVIPSSLRELKISGSQKIEFYRAWKPL